MLYGMKSAHTEYGMCFILNPQKYKKKQQKLPQHKSTKSCHSRKNKGSWSWHFVKFLSVTHCSIPTLTGREKGRRGGVLSAAQITRFIISWLTISIQAFSSFSLSGYYNLSAAKCFSMAAFSWPYFRWNWVLRRKKKSHFRIIATVRQ